MQVLSPATAAIRTECSIPAIVRAFQDHLTYLQARFPAVATRNDQYMALAYTVRDRLLHRWASTAHTYFQRRVRTVCYLSAEYLLGPQLGSNILNLGLRSEIEEAMRSQGLDLDDLLELESEPGLGSGGLGRLAACFMDSLATLGIPAIGYGIRYEFGIFEQALRDGWQIELTDKWLRLGNPWEVARPEIVFDVKLGGHTEWYDDHGTPRVRWIPDHVVRGMAYDTFILGYHTNTVNMLRLWKAEATESFDFQAFNTGDYYRAVMDKVVSENLTKVLYPNDEPLQGKLLRLQQQYLLASCSLQDMLRIYFQRERDLTRLGEKYAAQLNDTHPAIAVAELMRLLVDEHGMRWDEAWTMCQSIFGYTNHTLMPEALERWPVPLFAAVLPRHLEIIYELNRRFLDEVRQRFPADDGMVQRLSLIDESGERYVRMANLACIGSHAINGVARLHSELLRQGVLADFHAMTPEKFSNKTNGVSPRRFVALANPALARLITAHIGDGWVTRSEELRKLEKFADDPALRQAWRAQARENKTRLARIIWERTGIGTDPDSMFDIQVKRLHEYKRQHLNILHVITCYNALRRDPQRAMMPRTVIFAGKAAPGYRMAKLIIKLITSVGAVVNRDSDVAGRLKVVFLPDFNVKNGQKIYPAADLSEQISLAGTEASGTGNMKFTMNGALTIGTLDGANIEIRDEVGADNFFAFGLSADQVRDWKASGYRPLDLYEKLPELREALDQIASGWFSPDDPARFRPLVDNLLGHDEYMVLADYPSYMEGQQRVSDAWCDPAAWTRMSILNVARSGRFSSDRAIREYSEDIWHVSPMSIAVE